MWFGTEQFMTEIANPLRNYNRGLENRTGGGQFDNGGAWERRSPIAATAFNYTWPLASVDTNSTIRSFLNGTYGAPLYALDPIAAKTNCLPSYMSAPWRGVPGWGHTGDVAAPASAGITYRWTGAPNASASEEVAPNGVTVLRTNLIRGPAFTSTSPSLWNIPGGSTWAGPGDILIGDSIGSGNIIVNAPYFADASEGEVWSAACTVGAHPDSASPVGCSVGILVRDASLGSLIVANSMTVDIPAGESMRLSATTMPLPAGAAHVQFYVYVRNGVRTGRRALVSDAILVQGDQTALEPYFDGDTPPQPGPPNTMGAYPQRMGTFADTVGTKEYKFPVPPGHTVWFGAHGTGTGLQLNGSAVTLLPPSNVSMRFNTQLSGVNWVTISKAAGSDLELRAMQMVILPIGETPRQDRWFEGEGFSGFQVRGTPTYMQHSAVLEHATYNISSDFVEVGAWN